MKIYLDLVFLINFFFDFVLLYATKYELKERVKLYRILSGSLMGAISIFFLFLKINTLELFFLKLMISIGMILITFGKNNFRKNFFHFYIISIFLGGSMYLLNQTFSYQNKGIIFFSNGLSINFVVMIILTPMIIYSYIKERKETKEKESNCYPVDLYFGQKKYELKGYLDTGNTLKDPYKSRSVILMDLSKIDIKKKKIYVPYQTITETGVIPCFPIDRVKIGKKEYKNLLIGDIKNTPQLENADCILPNSMKEDLC